MSAKIAKYYKILNLNQNCSDLQLRRAYRRLALEVHPDKLLNNSSHDKFQALNKIYNRLIAYRRRNIYNELIEQEKTQPIPMSFDKKVQGIFGQFQENFQKHMQTLDHIIESLKIMNNDKTQSCNMHKMKTVY